jgi:hypothetical protein
MDWVIGIQRAIDYIEENLKEELNYEEIGCFFIPLLLNI